LNRQEEDWPAFVFDNSACFKVTLEHTIRDDIGSEFFDECLKNGAEKFEIGPRIAIKKSHVIGSILKDAASAGKPSKTLYKVVENIVALRKKQDTASLKRGAA
jgi:hypothetical protein